MRPKINQKAIVGLYTNEDTMENNFMIRSLTQILLYLIEEGAPLNPESIINQSYSNTYNSGKDGEYTIYSLSVRASFNDSKQIMYPGAASFVNAKEFGLTYEAYNYLNHPDQNYVNLCYSCTENNITEMNMEGEFVGYPFQRQVYEQHARNWHLTWPGVSWIVNTIKDEETFYFGIDMIHDFLNESSAPIINAAFTPVKSLSDPTKKLDYCFFNIQNIEYEDYGEFHCYGGYICYSFPELGVQKVSSYQNTLQIGPVINFIEADETKKVVLLPVMIGIEDYYLDKIYLSNIIRKNHTEEAVELDRGIFLISGARYPVSGESKRYQSVALFDITKSMSQEEE